MKKILLIALTGLSLSSVYACDKSKDNNIIKYTTQAETSVKSDSILVQVTGYATTTLQDQNKVEQDLSSLVQGIIKADWKVKDVSQNTSQSGALNVTLELQVRISQADLNKLQSELENQKSANQKLVVQVLDYNPPAKDIELAKQNLMINIYNNTQKYLSNFNEKTNTNYIIQSIDYNDTGVYTPRASNNVMLMKSNSNEANSQATNVSKDINIRANVIFIER
jgi:hypothetical protein